MRRDPEETNPHALLLQDLGRAVRARRTGLGLTVRALSERARVSERYLLQLEKGVGNISVARLFDVATALGTTASALLGTHAPATVAPVPSHGRHVLALLGLRGAGKSTLGRRAAERLGVPFFELDALIERSAGMSLAALFELHGHAYYRRLERQALSELLGTQQRAVLATGGGLVTEHGTFDLLRRHAVTVWLKARPEDHLERVRAQGDERPMADRTDAMEDLRKLLQARGPLYERADEVVDTSALGLERALRAVLRAARKLE